MNVNSLETYVDQLGVTDADVRAGFKMVELGGGCAPVRLNRLPGEQGMALLNEAIQAGNTMLFLFPMLPADLANDDFFYGLESHQQQRLHDSALALLLTPALMKTCLAIGVSELIKRGDCGGSSSRN